MITIILFLYTLVSCSKTEEPTSIYGKWYVFSIDSKKATGTNCDMKDTTKLYTKDVNAQVYEFLPTGKVNVTTYVSGSPYTGSYDYKFENSQLFLTINGSTSPSLQVSNHTADGWRMQNTNYIYCPAKTAFTEYHNFKKY